MSGVSAPRRRHNRKKPVFALSLWFVNLALVRSNFSLWFSFSFLLFVHRIVHRFSFTCVVAEPLCDRNVVMDETTAALCALSLRSQRRTHSTRTLISQMDGTFIEQRASERKSEQASALSSIHLKEDKFALTFNGILFHRSSDSEFANRVECGTRRLKEEAKFGRNRN